jgi:hypothetical protein
MEIWSKGNGEGRWYMLSDILVGYVLCGNVGFLYAYMYMSLGGWSVSNFQYIFSTDVFVLTCFDCVLRITLLPSHSSSG